MANVIQMKQDQSKESVKKNKVIYFVSADGKEITNNYTFKQTALIIRNYIEMGIEFENCTAYSTELILAIHK
jgi:hypothetical protein